MVVKVYISGISGNKEVKKRQQRVMMILDSKNIKYDVIDITEPGRETDKEFMQSNSKSNGGTVSDPNPRSPLPPQLFNDEEYCGDYDQFDLANEVDALEQFLKMEAPPEETPQAENEKVTTLNGVEEETHTESTDDKAIADSTEDAEKSEGTTESELKESSPAKESSPLRDAESKPSKEGTPVKDETENVEGETKEHASEIESAERQKSVEKEATPEVKGESPEKDDVVTNSEAKETSTEKESVNANGTTSSREHSEEKDTSVDETELKKDNPSEALIQSEQAAVAE